MTGDYSLDTEAERNLVKAMKKLKEENARISRINDALTLSASYHKKLSIKYSKTLEEIFSLCPGKQE